MRCECGKSDRRHLWVGEDCSGHGLQSESSVATGHVNGRADTGCCRYVDELGLISAVTGGKDIWDASTHTGVNRNRPARIHFHAGFLEIQTLRVRRTSGCNQEL